MRLTQEQVEVLDEFACCILETPTNDQEIKNLAFQGYALANTFVLFVDANELQDKRERVIEKQIKENFEVDTNGVSNT